MSGGTLPMLGNNYFGQTLYASLTPAASISTDASSTSTYTIKGLAIGDLVDIFPQAAGQALLTIGSVWCATADTLSVQWVNSTGSTSSSSPTALTCAVLVIRCSSSYTGVSSFPQVV